MTSRDYYVVLVTSQYSESSYWETRTHINYSCELFKHTQS